MMPKGFESRIFAIFDQALPSPSTTQTLNHEPRSHSQKRKFPSQSRKLRQCMRNYQRQNLDTIIFPAFFPGYYGKKGGKRSTATKVFPTHKNTI